MKQSRKTRQLSFLYRVKFVSDKGGLLQTRDAS